MTKVKFLNGRLIYCDVNFNTRLNISGFFYYDNVILKTKNGEYKWFGNIGEDSNLTIIYQVYNG
jgi:hypothetical protein